LVDLTKGIIWISLVCKGNHLGFPHVQRMILNTNLRGELWEFWSILSSLGLLRIEENRMCLSDNECVNLWKSVFNNQFSISKRNTHPTNTGPFPNTTYQVELLLYSLLSHPRMTTLSYFSSSSWGGITNNSIPQNIRGFFIRGNKLTNLLVCYCERTSINQSIKLAHFPMYHSPQMLALSRAER